MLQKAAKRGRSPHGTGRQDSSGTINRRQGGFGRPNVALDRTFPPSQWCTPLRYGQRRCPVVGNPPKWAAHSWTKVREPFRGPAQVVSSAGDASVKLAGAQVIALPCLRRPLSASPAAPRSARGQALGRVTATAAQLSRRPCDDPQEFPTTGSGSIPCPRLVAPDIGIVNPGVVPAGAPIGGAPSATAPVRRPPMTATPETPSKVTVPEMAPMSEMAVATDVAVAEAVAATETAPPQDLETVLIGRLDGGRW